MDNEILKGVADQLSGSLPLDAVVSDYSGYDGSGSVSQPTAHTTNIYNTRAQSIADQFAPRLQQFSNQAMTMAEQASTYSQQDVDRLTQLRTEQLERQRELNEKQLDAYSNFQQKLQTAEAYNNRPQIFNELLGDFMPAFNAQQVGGQLQNSVNNIQILDRQENDVNNYYKMLEDATLTTPEKAFAERKIAELNKTASLVSKLGDVSSTAQRQNVVAGKVVGDNTVATAESLKKITEQKQLEAKLSLEQLNADSYVKQSSSQLSTARKLFNGRFSSIPEIGQAANAGVLYEKEQDPIKKAEYSKQMAANAKLVADKIYASVPKEDQQVTYQRLVNRGVIPYNQTALAVNTITNNINGVSEPTIESASLDEIKKSYNNLLLGRFKSLSKEQSSGIAQLIGTDVSSISPEMLLMSMQNGSLSWTDLRQFVDPDALMQQAATSEIQVGGKTTTPTKLYTSKRLRDYFMYSVDNLANKEFANNKKLGSDISLATNKDSLSDMLTTVGNSYATVGDVTGFDKFITSITSPSAVQRYINDYDSSQIASEDNRSAAVPVLLNGSQLPTKILAYFNNDNFKTLITEIRKQVVASAQQQQQLQQAVSQIQARQKHEKQ